MAEVHIRPAAKIDLPRLTEIYNHYVVNTPVTFDLEPKTVESRIAWFEQFVLTLPSARSRGEWSGRGLCRHNAL